LRSSFDYSRNPSDFGGNAKLEITQLCRPALEIDLGQSALCLGCAIADRIRHIESKTPSIEITVCDLIQRIAVAAGRLEQDLAGKEISLGDVTSETVVPVDD
jgi:hypothetical protein